MKLPFQLPPQSNKETQFTVLVSDVTFAQKLRGTLTYMFDDKEGTQQEKLDFTVHLTCSKFMVGHLSHKDILTELLTSGQLVSKIKKEVTPSQDFDAVLGAICRKCNLTLVEQINDTASLYGHSLKGHHVCLLLKYNVSVTFLTVEKKR